MNKIIQGVERCGVWRGRRPKGILANKLKAQIARAKAHFGPKLAVEFRKNENEIFVGLKRTA